MYTVTIRFNDGEFVAVMDAAHQVLDSETEGVGETIADSLRDLADNMEALQL